MTRRAACPVIKGGGVEVCANTPAVQRMSTEKHFMRDCRKTRFNARLNQKYSRASNVAGDAGRPHPCEKTARGREQEAQPCQQIRKSRGTRGRWLHVRRHGRRVEAGR